MPWLAVVYRFGTGRFTFCTDESEPLPEEITNIAFRAKGDTRREAAYNAVQIADDRRLQGVSSEPHKEM
jgi:hypothetical protein